MKQREAQKGPWSHWVMMMVLCQKAGSLAFTPPGDEMSEVVSRCLPHTIIIIRFKYYPFYLTMPREIKTINFADLMQMFPISAECGLGRRAFPPCLVFHVQIL